MCCFEASVQLVPKSYFHPACRQLELQLILVQISLRIFGHPNMGTFGQNCRKCPYSGAQKWDFECRYPKTEATFSCQHSPKMVEWTFVSCVYHFWVRNQQIFKKCTFWTVLSRFSLSTDPKIEV